MTFQTIKNLSIIFGLAIGASTLFLGIFEYMRQGALKRAEYLFSMRKKFQNNERFANLLKLLELNSQELLDIPYFQKVEFIAFFEEVVLLMKSKLIKKEVAHYMFYYFAKRCWKSENFWIKLNRDSFYWSLFKEYIEQMDSFERELFKVQKSKKSSSRVSKLRI